jgi:hypothetical protein
MSSTVIGILIEKFEAKKEDDKVADEIVRLTGVKKGAVDEAISEFRAGRTDGQETTGNADSSKQTGPAFKKLKSDNSDASSSGPSPSELAKLVKKSKEGNLKAMAWCVGWCEGWLQRERN